MDISSSINNAYNGIQLQHQRLQQNVAEVASSEAASGRNNTAQDRALVEQSEIVTSFQANARSLQAAGQLIGTLIDIKV